MAKILDNTTGNIVFVADTGISIPANSQYTIPATDYLLWGASSNAITYIGDGTLVVNDGSQDLSISDGTDLIKGYYPHKLIGASDGTPIGNVADALKVTGSGSNGTVITVLGDTSALDAFGRLRTSIPSSVFNSIFSVDKELDKWSEAVTTGGTSTHNALLTCVDMAVTTSSGSKVIRQTRRSIYYLPGLSKIHYQTFTFNAAKTNLRQRIGAFNEENGVYLELTGTTKNLVVRSSTSGSAVNNEIAQSNWNKDKLDGTGASGITLDLTKTQILFIDCQWLGVGRVRVGFIIGGQYIIAHEFLHANILTNVYTQTAKWHLRVEIENLGITSEASTLCQICSSVVIEGDGHNGDNVGTHKTVNNGTTQRGLTSNIRVPILSLRVKSAYNLVSAKPLSYFILIPSNNDIFFEIIINGTLTGASWVTNTTFTDKDVSGTLVTGGTVIGSGYVRSGNSISQFGTFSDQTTFLGHDLSDISDIITIACTAIASNGNAFGSIDFQEIY